ncbi:hypothetical protein [Streptomyces acidiscabies]|uniref:hypothetical protein n=1 Tax=Streptomyces acidiscabies TaxID=42234 RepID=UPI0038F7DCBF
MKSALNPLLDLLSDTLLTTPNPASLPRVGQLWNNSWQTALACYALLVALAGIVVMSHETVQTRHSAKEIAPRIPVAFLAAALSLFLAGKAVDLANVLSRAALSGGADADTAGPALRDFVLASFNSGEGSVFLILMWLAVVIVLVALLMTFVVRVALTIILVAGAPLALICHVLPQTDAVARWWWRVFGGVLAIQVAQSLALITGVRVFLTPGGFGRDGLFGLNDNGLVDVLVTLALLYIVFKIPFWILGSVRLSSGHSLAGSVARTYVMYKTFGLLHGRHTAVAGTARRNPPPGAAGWASHAGRPSGPRPGGPPPRRLTPPGPALFLPPHAPYPGPSASTGHAAGPPPMPTFQAPGTSSAPAAPPPRPLLPPGLPVFQAPGTTAPTPAARRVGRAPAPARPLFQPPTPPPRTPPRHATQSPAPAVFQPPVPPPPPARPARTSPPPPTTFVAPPPPRAYPTRGGDTS